MNKINLCEILKNVPKGTELYSPIAGEVKFDGLDDIYGNLFPIDLETKNGKRFSLTKEGYYFTNEDSECLLWPSKKVRTWEEFTVKKPKFDPKTLKPFDKVLGSYSNNEEWTCRFVSHINEEGHILLTTGGFFTRCIPYNDDTKHLVGTTDEAPKFYRYWED